MANFLFTLSFKGSLGIGYVVCVGADSIEQALEYATDEGHDDWIGHVVKVQASTRGVW